MPSIVIGSSVEQKIPSLVLEHSIRKRSSLEGLRIIHTFDRTFPTPKKPANRSRTGFSFVRFAIPELTGFSGVGAYLECDQLVMADVKELFATPFEGATVLRTPNQASVLLLDCSRLTWRVEEIVQGLDEGRYSYADLMERLCVAPPTSIRSSIPVEWNSLERYDPGKTKLLHYTAMNAQPWRNAWDHPLRGLWAEALRGARDAGLVTRDMVEEEIRRGHVVPRVREYLG